MDKKNKPAVAAIVYHRVDLDGLASMAVVRNSILADDPDARIVLYPYTYGDRTPTDALIALGPDRIVMADASLPPEEMLRLKDRFGTAFIWIDHHATAIDDSVRHGYDDLAGLREVGRAACRLCWEVFGLRAEAPRAIDLLSRYDVWDTADGWEDEVLPFQWAMREEIGLDPGKIIALTDAILGDTDGSFVRSRIDTGRAILSYARHSGAMGVDAYGFPVSIGREEHPGVACLTSAFGSLAFEKTLGERPGTVAVCVNRIRPKEGQTEETYKVSIYAGPSDPGWHIGEYLKETYGGGGHRGAGGATLTRAQFVTLITEGRL